MSKDRYVVCVVGLLLTVPGQIKGTTIDARSASLADISSAIATAKDGDTVVVPAGSAHWTSTLFVTKGITLQGATTTNKGAYSYTAGADTSAACNDKTIILDDIPRIPANKGGAIIKIDLSPRQRFRLTGFTFRAGSVTANGNNGGIRLGGTCPSARIDHCHFDKLFQSNCIHTFGWIYGVIDHCIFDCVGNRFSVLVWHDAWGGKSYGEGSWAEPSYWGSEKFVFIEDNIINNSTSKVQTGGNMDAKQGGRYVARHNAFYNSSPNSHGTEYNPQTGARAIEVYNNSFDWTLQSVGGQLRSGTLVTHDNSYTGIQPGGAMALAPFRQFYCFKPWGGANGNNKWDANDPHGIYASGKHTGASNSQKLIVANAGWTPDHWVGYQLTNTSAGPRPDSHFNSFITANSNDTITYELDKSFGPYMTFNTGDGFAIYKLIASLDQPGRGQRDLISRDPQGNPVSGTSPRQALDPVYCWNNKWNDEVLLGVRSKYPTIQEDRDYYNNTPKPGYTPYTYPHPLVKESGKL